MKKIKVLYGFNNDKVMGNIEKALKALGRESLVSIRPNKPMIKEFIDTHPDLDVVVLKEYLDGGEQYGIEEFIELIQHTHVRFIILIGENYRGRKEIAELYAEGILDALFSDGKVGVDTAMIAELMVQGRTRAEAKQYYRIDKGVPERRKITCEEYRQLYGFLKDKSKGANLMDRLVTISRMISPLQMGHFLTLLPDGMIKALKKYKEFYELNTYIYRLTRYQAGQKMKAPANARSGLTREIFEQKLKSDNLSKPEDYHDVVITAAPRVEDAARTEESVANEAVEEFETKADKADGSGMDGMDLRAYADLARQNSEARREERKRILEMELNKLKNEENGDAEDEISDAEEPEENEEAEETAFDIEDEEMSLMDILGNGGKKSNAPTGKVMTGGGTSLSNDNNASGGQEKSSAAELSLENLLDAYG